MTTIEERCLSVGEFLQLGIPIVDVRAPVEFHKGHIPDALNIPLLDNDNRHHVGLCYRQHGHHAAVQLGLKLVGPEMAGLAQAGLEALWTVTSHCIVSGRKRSQSMEWLWT